MTVQRFNPVATAAISLSEQGEYVKYADYEKLAAENEKAMESMKLADAAIKLAHAKFSAMAAENAELKDCVVNHAPAVELWNAWADPEDKIQNAPETPATSAYLAEVRAAAVDDVCLKISNAIVNCYQGEQVGLDAAATICGDFASELREGADK